VIDVRYISVAGPKKGCWETSCPQTTARDRNKKVDPHPDVRGDLLSGEEALRLLILSGVQSGQFKSKAFRSC
jgi:hypothetical protein